MLVCDIKRFSSGAHGIPMADKFLYKPFSCLCVLGALCGESALSGERLRSSAKFNSERKRQC